MKKIKAMSFAKKIQQYVIDKSSYVGQCRLINIPKTMKTMENHRV